MVPLGFMYKYYAYSLSKCVSKITHKVKVEEGVFLEDQINGRKIDFRSLDKFKLGRVK